MSQENKQIGSKIHVISAGQLSDVIKRANEMNITKEDWIQLFESKTGYIYLIYQLKI